MGKIGIAAMQAILCGIALGLTLFVCGALWHPKPGMAQEGQATGQTGPVDHEKELRDAWLMYVNKKDRTSDEAVLANSIMLTLDMEDAYWEYSPQLMPDIVKSNESVMKTTRRIVAKFRSASKYAKSAAQVSQVADESLLRLEIIKIEQNQRMISLLETISKQTVGSAKPQ